MTTIKVGKARIKLSNVSQFTGLLHHKETKAEKVCDACGKERATWLHESKDGKQQFYLCFGCGGH